MADPLELVCCYARDDEKGLQALLDHLKPLERMGEIRVWHDRQIEVGTERYKAIETHLESAQIVILLISSSFLASDYSYSQEMRRALERQEHGEARVIPVILRHCAWRITPIGKLVSLPSDSRPIGAWENNDAAFLDVIEGVQSVVNQLRIQSLRHEAEEQYKKRAYPEALLLYEQAITLQLAIQHPDAYQRAILACLYEGKADAFYAQNRFEEANQSYDLALALDDNLPHSNDYKGHTLLHLQRQEEALTFFKRAIQQTPNNQHASLALLNTLLALNREQEALAFCEHIQPRFPYDFQLQESAARLFQKHGKYEQALVSWEQIIALIQDQETFLSTTISPYYQKKAEVLEELQRYQEALLVYQEVEMFKKIAIFKADDAPFFLRKGQLLTRLWRYEEALDAYEQAITLNPQLQEAYFGKRGVYETLAQRYIVQARQAETKERSSHEQFKSHQGQFKRIHTLRAHTNRISCLALSPTGNTLVSASYDGNVRSWDLSSGPQEHLVSSSIEPVRDIAFSPDGTLIAGCWAKGRLTVWDSATGDEYFTHRTAGATSLAFSPNGQRLMCGCTDGTIKTWSISGTFISSFPALQSQITRVAISPFDTMLACGDNQGGKIALFKTHSGQKMPALIDTASNSQKRPGTVWSLFFSPDERLLFGAENGGVLVYDIPSREYADDLSIKGQSLQCCALSSNGRWLACGVSDNTIRIWHLSSAYQPLIVEPITHSTGSALASDLVLSHNGRVLVSGLTDGLIEIWMRE